MSQENRKEPHLKPASQATDAAPGSREKIDELKIRFECGTELWHPDDKTVLNVVTGPPNIQKLIDFVKSFGG